MKHDFEYRFCEPLSAPEELGGQPPRYRRTVEDGVLIERDVPVPMRDGVRIYVDVFRPADETNSLRDLLTDDAGCFHGEGIPPGLIRSDVRAAMLQAAEDVLAPQFTEVVRKSRQPFFQPIFDLESQRIAFGRVALLGDAAFVARPHCGMGVTKAGADALALIRALAAHPASVAEAVSAYDRKRAAFGRFIVGHARHLGAYMQAQQKSDAERRMAERYRTPEAVMRETAVPPPPP